MFFKIACIQLNSSDDMADNISRVRDLVAQVAGQGAKLITLPENAFFMQALGPQRVIYNQEEHPAVQAAAEMALTHGVWLLAGSIAVRGGDENKTFNRSLLFNPHGIITASYDKIHLFDVTLPNNETYAESVRFLAGAKAVVTEVDSIKLGMTICYDLRFPQLFRALAKTGAQVIAVPSAFTQVTGEAHWHVLLRARAIETGCYIIAPAQCGIHAGGRGTYGHSLIVDPWGKILVDGGTPRRVGDG